MQYMAKVVSCLIAVVCGASAALAEIRANLPDGYLQLKWLESTGAQRIDTKEVPGATVAVKMNYNTGTYAHLTAFFGQGWTSSQYLFNQQSSKYYFHGTGAGVVLCNAGSAIDGQDASVEILTTSTDNMIVTIGEQAYTNTVSLACGGGTLNLFGCTDAAKCAAFRLYDFTMWRSGALIHQWVPATNVVSGKVGIFDIANPSSANAFLVNANSGADFIPGPIMDRLVVAPIPQQTFTGSAIEPELDVRIQGEGVDTPLTKDDDYDVTFVNNVGVGTATATVVGKGDYADFPTVVVSFEIAPPTVEGLELAGDFSRLVFVVGWKIKVPGLVLRDADGQPLAADSYEIGLLNADKTGTATVWARVTSGPYDGAFVVRALPIAVVPADYMPVEWVGSTGDQWVDTGVVPVKERTGIDIRFGQAQKLDNQAIFAQQWSWSNGYLFWLHAGGFKFDNSRDVPGYAVGRDYHVTIAPGGSVTMDYGAGETTYTGFNNGTCAGKTLGLFAPNGGGSNRASYQLYSFTMTDDGVTVCDLIPVRRVSDGKPGFYDVAASDPATAFRVNMRTGADLQCGDNKVGFRVVTIPCQPLGATPVPQVIDDAGNEIAASNFTFSYAGNDAAGTATVTATGKSDSDYVGRSAIGTFTVSARAEPDTFTWAGNVSGNFEDDAKWTLASGGTGHPEIAGDIVILPKFMSDDSYTVTVNAPFGIGALTVGDIKGGTLGAGKAILLVSNGLEADRVDGDIVVKDGGVLAQAGNSAVQDRNLYIKVGGNVVVEEGGAISATGAGFSIKNGAGGTGSMCTGAAYAGYGYGNGKKPYGSILRPKDWGSSTCSTSGGGAIRLEVAGDVTVDGVIEANGSDSKDANYASCGGSVWIECETISGSGSIEAKEASRSGTQSRADCNSSGGRIAVYQRTGTDFTSFPASRFVTSRTGNNAAGTVYLESTATRDLYLQGGPNNSIQRTVFPMPDDGDDLSQYADLSIHLIGNAHLGVCDLHPGAAVTVRSVEMTGNSLMTVAAGTVLRVVERLDMTGAKSVTGTTFEFVGEGTATVLGASKITLFEGIVCTNAGKTIAFGTAAADKLTVGLGVDFIMKGSSEAPVSLVSTAEGEPWLLSMNPNPGVYEVDHVAVRDSDASSGAPMLAISSQNLGNNTNWGFSNPIVPGETITWTGALSAKWDAAENWNPSRAPVETDRVVIPAAAANYPTLPSGTYLFNAIAVPAGAALTLAGGCALTVTNDLTVAGALIFTGGEDLYLAGNASFFGGTVTKAGGKIHLVGADDQTVDFGGNILFKVYGEKPSGNVSFGAHGFAADAFTCAASAPITYTFAAGATYTVPALSLSSIGADRQITLASSVPGTAWKLVTTASDQSVAGVEAHDCDASEGATVMAGTKSVATDNCTNWDTVTSIAAWLGGSGDWTDPAKWSTGEAPGETDSVTVSAADGETLTLTVPAGANAVMKSLTLKAGTGGKATLLAKSGLTVEADVDVQAGTFLVLDAYDDGGEAPNLVKGNVRVRDGGVITHSGPANEQNARVHLKVLGDFTVDAGGAVDVNGKGYNSQKGPMGNTFGNCHGSGHAGYGYSNSKMPYGSILHPITWGSASNNNPAGGAIRLDIGGTLTVNGEIRADGFYSNDAYSHAGGSVWIDCAALVGDGYIYAREGWRTSWVASNQTTSSGGRIAIYQHAAENFDAFPKSRIITNRQEQNSAGTVYLECVGAAGGADLYVVGSTKNTTLQTSFPMPDDGDPLQYTNVNVHVGASAVLYVCDQMPGAKVAVRSLTVTDSGRVQFAAGSGLFVRETLDATGSGAFNCAGTGYIEFGGDGDGVLLGAKKIANFASLVCTNAGKVVRFGTGENDVVKLEAGMNLMLQGEEGNPVTLLPLDGEGSWQLDANANANLSVKYVAASNSTALTQAVLAMESEDLGGNVKWSFVSEIKPDAPIHWTGEVSTDWADVENWDEKRTPILTDKVYVDNVSSGYYPVLANGVFTQLKLYVETGAKLTLSDATLVVSNEFAMAGELIFAGAEELCLTGDADFKGGSVHPQDGVVRLLGDGYQTIDFGGVSLRYLNIDKPSGVVVMNGDLTAAILRCDASAPLEIQFAQGVFFDVADLYLNGGAKNLTLKRAQPGGNWSLKATADGQCVTGVKVSGCTAEGATIYAGRNSSDEGGNVNWDFAAETAVWLGGSGDWTDASHWSLGVVPSAGTQVMLNVGEGADVTITVPKASAVSVASLSVRAADGGTAKIVANSPLAVAGDVDVGLNSTLELNCYDDDGEAPNVVSGDVLVRAGGRITHTGPADAENAKVHLRVAGDMTVEEDGSVDANAKGYSKAKGPGSTGTMCQGAAHAGNGHGNGAQPYGSVFRPVTWGSGNSGCCGGGAVHLVVTGALTVDGRISADGGVNGVYVGAGGSVWVECARLVGGGSMSVAEGTRLPTTSNLSDCTSSGGRIAVYQRVASDFSAFPLAQMYTSWLGSNAAGTIYLESVGCPGQLLIDLGNRAVYDSTQSTALFSKDEVDLGKFAEVNVTVRGTASVVLYADVTVRDLVLVASDTAGKKVPHVYLNGKTMKVRSVRHENGRKWFKSYEAAIESGHVVIGGTTLNPGKILWIGGADGAFLWFR